jgi:glycerophosphoryl diester phosphodiesterase
MFAAVSGCSSEPRTQETGASLPWERPGLSLIAHRGAHLVHPENSLPAIRGAAGVGAILAEIDLRTTSDGAIVLMHDRTVDRTTDGAGFVASLTLAQVRALHLRGPKGELTNELVPTFAEALDAARGRVALYLDVKEVSVEALASSIERTAPGDVLVYLDNDDIPYAERFHERAPRAPILFECDDAAQGSFAASRLGARAFASSWRRFTSELARAGHGAGGVWIVDAVGTDPLLEKRVREVVERGGDGIQTDDPARVLACVRSR